MRRMILAVLAMALTTSIMAQMTNEARAESSSLELCLARRNSTEGQQKINVKVGGQTFTATLLDNETAREFANRLPVTLSMQDVNGNEKYATFSQSFPGTRKVAGNIKAGDLKIWSGNGLVLFYDSFSSSYSYYDLGSIDDATGLREALGSGTVSVTFEFQATGIHAISNSNIQASGGHSFQLNGQLAREGDKGIIITNGKKRIAK